MSAPATSDLFLAIRGHGSCFESANSSPGEEHRVPLSEAAVSCPRALRCACPAAWIASAPAGVDDLIGFRRGREYLGAIQALVERGLGASLPDKEKLAAAVLSRL
ncbi:MAG TPA: hypothetical protein VGL78_08805 [Solirubrobacteraceae bacterium]